MVSRTLIAVNVILVFMIVSAVFHLSHYDNEMDVTARRQLKGRSGGSSSRSSSSRSSRSRSSSSSSSRSGSSSSSSKSRSGTSTTRSSANSSAPPSYRSTTPKTSTYQSTGTYRSASTYSYTGKNIQTTSNTQTYSLTPTQYTYSYRSSYSADYYRTSGVTGAMWFGYQPYSYGYYYYNYYNYDRNNYRSNSGVPEPEPQLFTFVETNCQTHGCVALNETNTCLNAHNAIKASQPTSTLTFLKDTRTMAQVQAAGQATNAVTVAPATTTGAPTNTGTGTGTGTPTGTTASIGRRRLTVAPEATDAVTSGTEATRADTTTTTTTAAPAPVNTQQPARVTQIPISGLQPTFCVHDTTGTAGVTTEYTQATEDVCTTTYPCLCSCMVVLVDEASASTISIFAAAFLSLVALVL